MELATTVCSLARSGTRGRLVAVIGQRYPLERVASACQYFEEVDTERNWRVSDGNTSHFSPTLEKELADDMR